MKSFFISIFLLSLYSQSRGQVIVIDSVTVINGKSVITWQPSANTNTDKYYIYDPNSSPSNKIIDSALKNEIYKTYAMSVADTKKESFFVAAVDDKKNPISGFGLTHNSIYLEGLVDECNSTVSLKWNSYINWSDAVSRYEIYVLINGINPTLVYSGINTNYSYQNLLDKNTYNFFVIARSGNLIKTSTSNKISVKGNFKKAPLDIYSANLSYSSNSSLDFRWIIDSASVPLEYEILISMDGINFSTFDKIKSVFKKNNQINLTNLIPDISSYFVKINVKSTCPNQDLTSNIARSIYLRTIKNKSGENILDWNKYENWDNGIQEYRIYRKLNQTFSLYKTLGSNESHYEDFDPLVVNSEDLACYYVEAVQNYSTKYSVLFKSISNESCAFKEAQILVPNGFNPQRSEGGLEIKLFGLDPSTYSISIMNRFGQIFYQNSDASVKWDGKVNEKLLPVGTYVYHINVKDINGKPYQQSGLINVVY